LFNLEEVVVHNWDMVKATGRELEIDPAVGQMIYDWSVLIPFVDFREHGAFGSEVAVPASPSTLDVLSSCSAGGLDWFRHHRTSIEIRASVLPEGRQSLALRVASPRRRTSRNLLARTTGEWREGDENVSYLQVHFWPGGTEDQYLAMIKVLSRDRIARRSACTHRRSYRRGPPDLGALGLEGAERRLHAEHTPPPALPVDGGFAGAPEERTAQVARHAAI
jgi:hypothetical protein